MEFVKRQYPQVAMLSGQDAMSGSPDSGRESGGSGQDPKKKKKHLKGRVNAATLQEKQLCIFCYKHHKSQECFAKAEASYKGCGLSRCKDHHNAELHYVVTTARLFSVHASRPALYL